jgi:catechol 2,3-dioxygenase-like lactoylglutathione lyase family enzyme
MPTAMDSAIDEESKKFYRHALGLLTDSNIPFLVGGAYAFAKFTGIERHTKDFDIFIKRGDYERISAVLATAGYKTDLTFPHWLGKAYHGDSFIDLIYSAGNGVAVVDDVWFEKAEPGTVLEMPLMLIPPEEMIWSKGLIMERERFDGADVNHVIKARGDRMDWRRLIDRYGPHWRALFAHVTLFGFAYPSHRSQVPAWVIEELTGKLLDETKQPDADEKVCYGTIISRQQYLHDIDVWGYEDARLRPRGNMSKEEIAHWTAGIEKDGK